MNPDLVVNAENGEHLSVRYEVVNVMLLNEFLKEHESGEVGRNCPGTAEANQSLFAAGFEKVSAYLKMNGTARVVENTD